VDVAHELARSSAVNTFVNAVKFNTQFFQRVQGGGPASTSLAQRVTSSTITARNSFRCWRQ